jgi:putative peptidoglycan lipid II flippase
VGDRTAPESPQVRDSRKRIASSALLVMSLLAVGKAVGVIDDLVKARVFGTSADLDAFVAAGGLPELLNTVISGGALAAPFIPVLSQYLSRDDRTGGLRLISSVINAAFLTTAVLAVAANVFAPWIVEHVIASGFSPSQQALTVGLMRVTLLSTIVFSVSGVVMSVLHAFQHFLLPALAPILYNVGIIAGAVFLAPKLGVWGLAFGALGGSVMHLLIQVPGLLRYGVRWLPVLNVNDPGMRQVLILMGPRVLTLAVVQLNTLISVRMASQLASGSVSALNYGWRLMQMPETIIGTAVATAVFPALSGMAAQGQMRQLNDTLSAALRAVLVMGIPAALGLILMGRSVIALLFRGGQFGAASADAVFAAMSGFAVGLVGYAAVEVAARGFFARKDTKTPLAVSVVGLVFTVACSLTLRGPLGHAGLALASSLAILVEFALLLWLTDGTVGGLDKRRLFATAWRAVLAATIMGLVLVGWKAWWPYSDSDLLSLSVFLCVGVIVGTVAYLAAGWFLGLEEVRALGHLMVRRGIRTFPTREKV